MYSLMTRHVLVVLVGVAAAVAPHASQALTLEDFRSMPDNRIAVRTSLGVRSVRPLGPSQVELVLGLSSTPAAENPLAWRVVSNDDPDYAYEKFVCPSKAGVKKAVEAEGPDGCPFPKFETRVVTLDLPTPMKEGKSYDFIAQGVNGGVAVGGHAAQGVLYKGTGNYPVPDNALDLAVIGLRRVEPAGNGVILLEFGPGFSPKAGSKPESYAVTIGGKPASIVNLGRISKVDTYLPVGWPFVAIPLHEVFLQCSPVYKDGDTITVKVDKAATAGAAETACAFDSAKTLCNSIKVNQIGYLTDSPVKVAYLGRWMGSFPEIRNGAPGEGEKKNGQPAASADQSPTMGPALAFEHAPAFQIIPEKGGAPVFSGAAKLIHRSGTFNEGIYPVDHSGENVYLLDFTGFKTPGRYAVVVPGVGRSLSFMIGDDAYKTAFEVQAHGVFTQRCGIELKPPYSDWRRIACHKKGLTLTSQIRSEKHDIAKDLPAKTIYEKTNAADSAERAVIIQAFGGHHDAGDYNPRSHYEVAQKLMNAYEMAPKKFFDGQLNIPEKGNGLPDILDEAYWALRLWIDLQDADGGVRNGTESNGDPNFIQTVELDPKGDYAYAKDAEGSLLFAGMMAQASRLWRANGKTAEADDFLAKAVKAYDWAVANPLKTSDAKFYGHHIAPPKAYAAAQLLHTTKDPKYNKDFLEVCVWVKKPDADVEVYGQYDMQDAAWAYAACPAEIVAAAAQDAIKKAIVKKADIFIQHCSTMAYAFIRHPWAPINWGTGAYENGLNQIIQAHKLTGDKKYLLWIVRTCDNTLGANPLNRSYIVGAGTRTVRAPLHNSRYCQAGEVVDGQQVEGPVQKGDGYRVAETAYPKINDKFAPLYTFVDNHFAIGMDEGMSPTQAQTMAVFGLLLPDAGK